MAMEYWNARHLPESVRPPFDPAQHCRIGGIFVKEGFRLLDGFRQTVASRRWEFSSDYGKDIRRQRVRLADNT